MKMEDTKFMTAKEKGTVLKAWERFMVAMETGKESEGLFRLFTKGLYNHLIMNCSFIAHYDRSGFFRHYLTEPEMTFEFLRQFDNRGPCQSVEYGMDYWARNGNDACREYYDINQEMVRIASEHIPAIQARLQKHQEGLDVTRAKALLGKHGYSLETGGVK